MELRYRYQLELQKNRVFLGYFLKIVEKIYISQTFYSKKSENKEKYISC